MSLLVLRVLYLLFKSPVQSRRSDAQWSEPELVEVGSV
jgi:hypothetical protein